ncbi:MAG: xanthine dehydrogenase family protein subunit M [Hyphomicrobiaceae bacterium]|nr:xanthine dehydrogenase family protein subunit M [Hyphomicrobiaceae bacterium]
MQPFAYERPTTVEQAARLLANDGARALAGGTDLVPQLRERRRHASLIVDLKHIPDLTAVSRTASGGWLIGAATTISRLGADAGFAADHAGLIQAARLIGSLQIQSRASLGGNLANGAPSADAVPLLISLDAQAEIAGAQGRRRVPVHKLPSGPGRTTLAVGELLVALHLPPRPPRTAARYLRFTPRREMDIAIAGAGVVLTLSADGSVADARITLASVAPIPLRAARAESSLVGHRPTQAVLTEAGRIAAAEARPISDTRGSADYRRDLVAVLTRRALEACVGEIASGGARP